MIDLKFASVREGRGTDRRFGELIRSATIGQVADLSVFEIVTPTQGRRLYQATSDTEMKVSLFPSFWCPEDSIADSVAMDLRYLQRH